MTTFVGPADLEPHVEALQRDGADVRVVRPAQDKAAVLEAFATALELPEWFGHNWDALLDALREAEGRQGRRLEIVWQPTSALRDDGTYATVLDILEQVADERDDLGVTVVTR